MTARGFANRFARMLEALTADPGAAVQDVQLLDSDELRTLERWNEPGVDTGVATVASLFTDRATRTPTAPAVLDTDTALTYGELSARANRLARLLISLGARPEALVAVVLPRSTELVVALTAVLTSGGGYLPIDVTNPIDRIRTVLADADPVCVLTTTQVRRCARPRPKPGGAPRCSEDRGGGRRVVAANRWATGSAAPRYGPTMLRI